MYRARLKPGATLSCPITSSLPAVGAGWRADPSVSKPGGYLRDNGILFVKYGAPMHTRQLGQSALEITPIGLGAWAIGGAWRFGWGPQDDADSIATIQRAVELGINW